jgi:hypothetical protein
MTAKYSLSVRLPLYSNAASARMQLSFEAPHLTFELIDALSKRLYVVADWVVDAIKGVSEVHNFGP